MENVIEQPRLKNEPSGEEIRERMLLYGETTTVARTALAKKNAENAARLKASMPAAFESISKSQQKIDAAQAKLNAELERVDAEREKVEFALNEVRLLIIRVASTRTELAKLSALVLTDADAEALEDKLADSFLTLRQSDTAQNRSQAQADLDEIIMRRNLSPGVTRRIIKFTAEAQSHIAAVRTTAAEFHIDVAALLDTMKIDGVDASEFTSK